MSASQQPEEDPNQIPDSIPKSLRENPNYQYYISHQRDWLERGYKGLPVTVSNDQDYISLPNLSLEEKVQHLMLLKKIREEDKTAFSGVIGFPTGRVPRRSHMMNS